MNANISVFVTCVEEIMYLLLYIITDDCTFKEFFTIKAIKLLITRLM